MVNWSKVLTLISGDQPPAPKTISTQNRCMKLWVARRRKSLKLRLKWSTELPTKLLTISNSWWAMKLNSQRKNNRISRMRFHRHQRLDTVHKTKKLKQKEIATINSWVMKASSKKTEALSSTKIRKCPLILTKTFRILWYCRSKFWSSFRRISN